jgi:AcrR family transcriptional regulator
VESAVKLTPKGRATRARIVAGAADLILQRGVGGTSLDDIRADTGTSKGQLFHYFPAGKSELVGAIAALQAGRVLDAQRPYLDTLASWEDWERWRDAVIAHYEAQPGWGCPIGQLTAEVAAEDAGLAQELVGHVDAWRAYLEAGIRRMIDQGALAPETDARLLSLSVFSALQGGLLLMRTYGSSEPLIAALDAGLVTLRAHAHAHAPGP